MRPEPTEKQLLQALDDAGCRCDLATARRNPAMWIALVNTAATQADSARSRRPKAVIIDFKKLCAGDDD